MSEPAFSLFSSLRYDPLLLASPENSALSDDGLPSPLYLLAFHRDRMLAAATHFGWSAAVERLQDLESFRRECTAAVDSCFAANKTPQAPLKLKTLMSPTGDLTIETSPTPPLSSLESLFPSTLPSRPRSTSSWKLHVDTVPTTASPFTTYKTTSRDMYTSSRERANIASFATPEEVILWNEDGELMEGSLTSVYFFRDGEWVTPPISSGGQAGATRRWLLEKRMVKEKVVRREDVVPGEWALVSNGVRGIWGGYVG